MSEKKTYRVLVRKTPSKKEEKEETFTKRVFYRDKKLVSDRPVDEVTDILFRHVMPGDDYNPTGETAKAAMVVVHTLSEKVKDGRKKGGDHKRGKFGPMRSVVDIFRPRSLNDLLSMLEGEIGDNDEENDHFGNVLPVNRSLLERGYKIRIEDVNREDKTVYYSVNGAEEDITFATLRNYISASKKTPFTGC
jgi:hypothetical protein